MRDRQIDYSWVNASAAAKLARSGHPITEHLRKGHGIYAQEEFAKELAVENLELIYFPNSHIFLVGWGQAVEGKQAIIWTVGGDNLETCDYSLLCFESAVAARGGKVILSIGRKGFTEIVKRSGYTVDPLILMRKVL